jgi:hypothetical protein
VDAILEATIQVLLDAGKERLTTTNVALRAGVSVGTFRMVMAVPIKSYAMRDRRWLKRTQPSGSRVCNAKGQ